jgi:hypothetical protein
VGLADDRQLDVSIKVHVRYKTVGGRDDDRKRQVADPAHLDVMMMMMMNSRLT